MSWEVTSSVVAQVATCLLLRECWGRERAESPASRGPGFVQSSAKAASGRKAFQISKMPRYVRRRLQRPEGASQPWE